MQRKLGLIFMSLFSFATLAGADVLTGTQGDELARQLAQNAQDQNNLEKLAAFETEIQAAGFKMRSDEAQVNLTVQARTRETSGDSVVTYRFELRHAFDGQFVQNQPNAVYPQNPAGTARSEYYRQPIVTIGGRFTERCSASGTDCVIVANSVTFGAFSVQWMDLPPVGGSSSSAGGRD